MNKKTSSSALVIGSLLLGALGISVVLSGCSDQDPLPPKNQMNSLSRPRSMPTNPNAQPGPNNPTGAADPASATPPSGK